MSTIAANSMTGAAVATISTPPQSGRYFYENGEPYP